MDLSTSSWTVKLLVSFWLAWWIVDRLITDSETDSDDSGSFDSAYFCHSAVGFMNLEASLSNGGSRAHIGTGVKERDVSKNIFHVGNLKRVLWSAAISGAARRTATDSGATPSRVTGTHSL